VAIVTRSTLAYRRRGLSAVVSTAVLVAVGCGGGAGSGSSTEGSAAAQDWANGLCQAVGSWNDSITSAGTGLKDNPTEEGLRKAADEVQSATQTLSDDLKGLGTPETESGQQAKDSVDHLAGQLDGGLEEIQGAVDGASSISEALTAISTVSSTLVAMGDEVSSTVRKLRQADAQGELADAFRQAGSCSELSGTTTG
jgi:hypothetical protein